jgi:hypothetical protein
MDGRFDHHRYKARVERELPIAISQGIIRSRRCCIERRS